MSGPASGSGDPSDSQSDGTGRSAHPAGHPRPGCFGPLCLSPVASLPGRCGGCGVVFSQAPQGLGVDPAATRAELFAAASACAGRTWSLRAVLAGSDVTEPVLLAAYQRLERAETAMATLVRRSR